MQFLHKIISNRTDDSVPTNNCPTTDNENQRNSLKMKQV